MYSDIERVLRFTDWWGPKWGRNFDALDDCLPDLPIRADGGAVVVFRRFNVYASGYGSATMHSGRTHAFVLLDVMARAQHFFLLTGKKLIVFIQTENPKIEMEGIGGVSPVWNRREWMIKDRITEAPSQNSDECP
jgi:hypothetical protein